MVRAGHCSVARGREPVNGWVIQYGGIWKSWLADRAPTVPTCATAGFVEFMHAGHVAVVGAFEGGMRKRLLFVAALMAALLYPAWVQAQEVQNVALATNDLIYDPFREKIYASVPSRAGALGNTVTAIDPATGAVGPSVFVGSEPGKMAISDDGQFLYVALNGAAAVRRVNLVTGLPDLQFGLDTGYSGPNGVEDIEVVPGSPHSVAVSRNRPNVSPSHGGVVVYDNGSPRPAGTPDHTGPNRIEFSSSPARMYGIGDNGAFYRLSVDGAGVSILESTRLGSYGSEFEVENGRVYVSTGQVIDPESRTLLGTFAGLENRFEPTLVRPASDLGLVFFLKERVLRAFSPATFLQVGSLSVPAATGTPGSLIRWGADGLAFRTVPNFGGIGADRVFLIGSFTAPPPPPPAGTPTIALTLTGCEACHAGRVFRVVAHVTNPSSAPVPVEVKAGVVLPNGSAMNVSSLSSRHLEATLAPGASISVELLRAVLPDGLAPGAWLYEAALITPELGRTLSRDSKVFTIEP